MTNGETTVSYQRIATTLSVVVAGAVSSGCGDMPDGEGLQTTSRTDALECLADVGDPNCTWKGFSLLQPSNAANDIVHKQGPAVCGDERGAVVISVDSSKRYRSLGLGETKSTTWGVHHKGSFNSFHSPPTCTLGETDSVGRARLLVAGKGSDGRIYASAGVISPHSSPQTLPVSGTYYVISGDVYTASATEIAGQPAMATGGFNASGIALVVMGNDKRTIYAYTHGLPWSSGYWSNRITGPTLPSGWTAAGAPSIVAYAVTFYIVVHAHDTNGNDRLYFTHFDGDDEEFSNSTGSPMLAWESPHTELGDVDGTPALAYSPNTPHGTTIYFLRRTQTTGQIMQTTRVTQWGDTGLHPVKPNEGHNIASSPSASDGWGYDSQGGTHFVVARTTGDKLVHGITMEDGDVIP